MKRIEALHMALETAPTGTLCVFCNGMIAREGLSLRDRPEHFYMIGSMGLGLSIALGVALTQPTRQVLCVDGDANVLMSLGAMATVGALRPQNLRHLILDNEVSDSTGGQATASRAISFDAIAAACGWAWTSRAADPSAAMSELSLLFQRTGPGSLLLKVEPGNAQGLARMPRKPRAAADEFRAAATGGCSPDVVSTRP
jgi:sulfopyruvate decarboxylase subunit beta